MGRALLLALTVCLVAIIIAGIYLFSQPSPSSPSRSMATQASITLTSTQSQSPLPKPVLKRKYIELGVADSTISYLERDYYYVRNLLQPKSLCKMLTYNLTEKVKRMYLTGVNYGNLSTLCVSGNGSLVVAVSFQVYGKVWVSDGEVYADFLWFLTPNNLDFIESKFNETTSGLTWQGVINGINTYINVRLPHQPFPYKAWGEPVGHCHGHVWWPKK